MPQPDETRLDDLKQRWAQDPGSRLYLQLADEHRKLGQLDEAEAVLVKGLASRPSDLSGLVALGRTRLELLKLDEAVAALESVVARDPAHLVANKLLLETHLQRGDAVKAGERLEICRLLNDRDLELEPLEQRLVELRVSPREPAAVARRSEAETRPMKLRHVEEPPPAEEPLPAIESAPAPPADEEPFAFLTRGTETEPCPAPAPDAAAGSRPAAADREASPMPSPSTTPASKRDDVFALPEESPGTPTLESLWIEHARPQRRADPFAGLSAVSSSLAPGDIFGTAPSPTVAARTEKEPVAARPVAARPVAARPAPARSRTDDGSVWPLLTREPSRREPVVYEELTDAARGDLMLDTQRTEFTVEDTAAAEPAVEEPIAEAGPAVEPREPAPEAAEPAPAAESPHDEEVSTVALGNLYLRQGYVEEAERIFAKVLERDPGNPTARAGLELARQSREESGWRLSAMDLLADPAASGALPAGTTAKKLLILNNYLEHIQAARKRSHVH